MNELARRRAYWLNRLLREHGWHPAELARHAGLTPRAGGQLLREWSKSGDPEARHPAQPRDAVLLAVSKALGVCPSKFHTPIPEVTP